MGEGRHYFIFNKEMDYRRGYLKNMQVHGGMIYPEKGFFNGAVFISRLLDSLVPETVWHRLKMKTEKEAAEAFRLSVYAGNEKTLFFEGRKMQLEDMICREDILPEEKKAAMMPWLQKEAVGIGDVLLHEVKGRYLWVMLEVYQQYGRCSFSDIRIYFPGQSWMKYLPEIYRQEDKGAFLERYLGIFQTIYEDLNEEIQAVCERFDVDAAQGEYLAWLAGWVGVEDGHIWSQEQLRRLLGNGVSFYRRRGTRQGIIDFIALYTGEQPFLVENHQLRCFRRDKERMGQYSRLYTDSPFSLSVLVREGVIHSRRQQRTLIRIIEQVMPAQLELNLILLKPYIFAGWYSYLGINSVLGSYSCLKLDGHSAVSFAVLGEEGGSNEKF